MSRYAFSVVTGVLPDPSAAYAPSLGYCLANKRTYLPRGCRPHLAWLTEATAAQGSDGEEAIGVYRCLTSDSTGDGNDGESKTTPATKGHPQLLHRLVTVDGATGKRLISVSPAAGAEGGARAAAGVVVAGTSPIPTGGRIASVIPLPPQHRGGGPEEHFIVSDNRGHVFSLRWDGRGGGELSGGGGGGGGGPPPPPTTTTHSSKRPREGEVDESETSTRSAATATVADAERRLFPYSPSSQWESLVPANSPIPSAVCGDGSGDAAPHFCVSHGSPTGFVGLGFLPIGGHELLCVREGFNDVRVIDGVGSGSAATVVRAYSTTHRPTALYIPSAWPGAATATTEEASVRLGPLAHTVLVCEGTLATLFDVRCPSAVMSVAQLFRSEPDPDAVGGGGGEKKAREQDGPPLVPGRLTSVLGTVSDVCATDRPFEVALAIDRALCVYDFRKFNRLSSYSNVLKYTVATVAATASGRAVVCAGVDSEVRIIPLSPKYPDVAVDSDAHTHNSGNGKQPQKAENTENVGDDPVEAFSTFRTRLNTSVNCETTWHGAWVTSCNAGGAAAVGISLDHEVFIAQ